MSQRLDDLLSQPRPIDAASLDKARALLAAELKAPRPRGWRGDALVLLAVSWGMAALVAVVLLAAGATSADLVGRHGAALGLVFAVGTACAWAAVAPPSSGRLLFSSAMGLSGIIGLVVLRALGVSAPSATPEWVCTVSHAGAGIAPLAVALMVLKKSAPHPLRAALAGLAVGTCGALIGEIGCAQPWQHVLVYHLSAWLALVAACAVFARRLVRSSYAP